MPEYTLIYFNGCGRAELVRWIFACGNIKYTDERFEMSEWANRKPNIHGGRVPLMMVDDKPLPQSLAQARYAAGKAGLIPKDSLHAAYCDALVDSIEEIYSKYFPLLFFEGTADEKAKKFKELHTSAITPFLTRLNKRLTNNTWFVGDKMSWGDLALANVVDQVQRNMPYLLDGFPSIASHVERVLAVPKIKEWMSKRPKTPF